MKIVMLYEEFTSQDKPKKPTKKLEDTGKYRLFKGDRYQFELLPLFMHLKNKNTGIPIADWFERTQQEDEVFYAKVQSGELAKPDIHELWRDLTARPFSKNQHIVNPNHQAL